MLISIELAKTDLADLFTIGSEVNKHWISKKDNESIIAKICQLDKNFNESVFAFIYEGKQEIWAMIGGYWLAPIFVA